MATVNTSPVYKITKVGTPPEPKLVMSATVRCERCECEFVYNTNDPNAVKIGPSGAAPGRSPSSLACSYVVCPAIYQSPCAVDGGRSVLAVFARPMEDTHYEIVERGFIPQCAHSPLPRAMSELITCNTCGCKYRYNKEAYPRGNMFGHTAASMDGSGPTTYVKCPHNFGQCTGRHVLETIRD